jgi:hypothetical protein
MTRRDEISNENEKWEEWRNNHIDYPESVAHLKYVEYLGWK